MINTEYLNFNVITKPEKDLFKIIQSNAKFKTLTDVIKTKVGINNFYNFSIAIQSSIAMRDIILNSQYVSGWARSSQVLNATDSKFSGYKFLTKNNKETTDWINLMESLQNEGHSMDNMRSLIFLDSICDYAISIDILHILYLTIILDSIVDNLDNTHDTLKEEAIFFLNKFGSLLKNEYDVNYHDFNLMYNDAIRDFPAINTKKTIDLYDITNEHIYKVNAADSVLGQIFRHRTLVKRYSANTYTELVDNVKKLTSNYDYNMIGMKDTIAKYIVSFTNNAKTVYDLCQGSIIPFEFSGTTGAVYKALCQRTCYINDSPQFIDAFNDFKQLHPELKLLPPCKLNTTSTNTCYVGYVNESRKKGEELTQKCCPIYAKSRGYIDVFEDSVHSPKTQWYINNLDCWKNVCI